MPCRLKVGLTGGLASGKSTAARCFELLGVPVIDADQVARELTEPSHPALEQVTRAFGTAILTPDGHLNRRALARQVFQDPEARERLESILHPLIRRRMLDLMQDLQAPYCILSIPLLLETGQRTLVDRVLVLDAPREQQVLRAMARDHRTREEVEAILASQLDRTERLRGADDILTNQRDPGALCDEVRDLHRFYISLAQSDLPAGSE